MTDAEQGWVPDGRPTPAQLREEARENARHKAIRTRQINARVRKAIKDRVIDDLALLRGDLGDFEPLIKNWTVDKMLRCCHRIGPQRAMEIMVTARLSPRVKMSSLPYAKREQLAQLVIEARSVPVG
jgi:hypothetical protein